jgi:sodium/potassium-transporting ATPase subunit alpha
MARCETILLRGETVPIGPLAAAQEGFSTQLASKGERVLGFAYLDLDPSRFPAGFKFNMDEVNFPTSGLTFVGLVSLIDPPRPGVQESIAICKKAGIRVIMVTGDHPITAEAIARSIGILQAPSETSPDFTSQERVIPGDKLNDMTDEQWEEAFCSQGLVFARTLPQQKQMIVSRLQDRGEIVAVTGDGVNDSPALKQASCGIAMGIMGSEIAKDAADIVLMDDNFCSIVAGIRQGRLTFTNVQKCCVHVMPHMQPELFTVILYIVIGIPSALNNLQLLTIDLGTDIPLGISLAWEAPEDEIMARPPRRVDERLTSWRFYFLVYLQLGLFETAYCFFVFFLLFSDHGFSFSSMLFTNNWFTSTYDTMDPADQISCDIMAANNHVWQAVQNDWGNNFDNYRNTILAQAQAAYLACVTICQMGAILGDKTQFSSFFTVWLPNWHIWIAFCIAITFSMLLTYTPIGWVIFQTAPINFKYYGIMLGGAVMMFSYHEIIKFCMRRSPNGLVAFFVKY